MNSRLYDLLLMLLLIGLTAVSGCTDSSAPTATTVNPSPSITPPGTTITPEPTLVENTGGAIAVPGSALLESVAQAPTRTPVAASTPGTIVESVTNVFQQIGLGDEMLLGLTYADWFNLAISFLVVAAAYFIAIWLIRSLIFRLVQQTKTTLDDQLLEVSGTQIRWLIVILTLRFATLRLTFIQSSLKTFLIDIYFFLALGFVIVILWRLTDLAARQAGEQAVKSGYGDRIESLLKVAVWAARLGILILVITLTFGHFAIDITGIAVFVAIITVVISIAGRDVLSDVISGVVILSDRPLRVGDRLDLLDLGTTGDVVDIGMRSTRIVTYDNRMVIYPNSLIAKNMIVNRTYPDPAFYDMTNILVAYENDSEHIIQLLTECVQRVEGVQKDRDIDVQLREFTEYHMRFIIGWWVASYVDLYVIRDRVNRAAMQTLRDANVVLPYSKANLSLQANSKDEVGDANQES